MVCSPPSTPLLAGFFSHLQAIRLALWSFIFGTFVFDVKLILRTTMIRSWNDLVCAIGLVHAAGPTPDQRTSECRHQDRGSSLGEVTRRYNAPIRRGDTENVRLPRRRPSQGCKRCGNRARIGDPCAANKLQRRLSGQRAPRLRVRQVRAERALRAEKLCRLPRVPRKVKIGGGKGGIGPFE